MVRKILVINSHFCHYILSIFVNFPLPFEYILSPYGDRCGRIHDPSCENKEKSREPTKVQICNEVARKLDSIPPGLEWFWVKDKE